MNKFSVENNGVKTSLIYNIGEDEEVDSVVFGMMTNNNLKGLVPMIFSQMDEQKSFKYDISSKVSMKQFFAGTLTRERVLKCFESIARIFIDAEDYMIDASSFVMNTDYIYIDVTNSEAEIICVPIKEYQSETKLDLFIKTIMFTTQFDQSENCDYVAKIISLLNGGAFSVVSFKEMLDKLLVSSTQPVEPPRKTINNVVAESPNLIQSPQPQPNYNTNYQGQMNMNPMTPGTSPVPPRTNSVPPVTSSVPPVNNMIPPRNQSIPIPAIPPQMPVQTSNPPKKKKGIFGFKKKDKKKKMEYSSNLNIPGAVKPINHESASPVGPKMGMPPVGAPTNGPMQKPPMGAPMNGQMQRPPMGAPMNFGETTVLNAQTTGETTVLSEQSLNTEKKAYLIRKKNNENRMINKEVFRIGKENSYVDYFIADNTAISRSHATILIKGDKYYVQDTNSKNHTYLNQQMIQSNMEAEIKSGDIIKLANEEFEFIIK